MRLALAAVYPGSRTRRNCGGVAEVQLVHPRHGLGGGCRARALIATRGVGTLKARRGNAAGFSVGEYYGAAFVRRVRLHRAQTATSEAAAARIMADAAGSVEATDMTFRT